jgi:thioredoxin reductase
MSLKSDGHASSIYDPSSSFTLSRYCAENGLPYADLGLPVPLETFASYGIEFQKRVVPKVEERAVTSVKSVPEGFLLSLDGGEEFVTRKLILAVGVAYFAYVPTTLVELSEAFASHSSRHADLTLFANQDVAILGAGASALDLAALLPRVGARPIVITREPNVQFHDRQHLPRSLRSQLRAPTSGIGPGWGSWFVCTVPYLFHRLPEKWRLRVTRTHAGPSGGWFVKDEVIGKVPVISSTSVESARADGDRVRLELSTHGVESAQLTVDHVIAATGYRVEVGRLTFLDETLRASIDTVERTPILSSAFESSVSGLYFIGPAAANSFGPSQRFAVGARFAARRVSRSLAKSMSTRS